jgi:hypothetical protein
MNSEKLLRKLTEIMGEDNDMTKTITNILAVNYVKVDNNITSIQSHYTGQRSVPRWSTELPSLQYSHYRRIEGHKASRGVLLPIPVCGRYGNHSKTYRELSIESSFKYLGITLQTIGTLFTKHVKGKIQAVIRAKQDIRNIES